MDDFEKLIDKLMEDSECFGLYNGSEDCQDFADNFLRDRDKDKKILLSAIAELKAENENLKSTIKFKDDALSSYSDFYAACCNRFGYKNVNPSVEMDEIIWNKLSEVKE